MPELIFEEPEQRHRSGGRTDELLILLLQMKEHPGKSVFLGLWPGESGANNMKHRLVQIMKDPNDRRIVGKYEFESRREHYDPKPSGGSKLYGRFVKNGD